jgi:transposase
MGGERLINIDRETPLLLPVDMRDWVREDDLAHFILEVVGGVDLRRARVNARGSGSEQYPPGMMLAVLIYCYANGIFSSRQIELQSHRNLSVRYLAGNTHPDHDTFCKFRRENGELIKEAFREVLNVAERLKLKQVGTVCLDGTKVLANAAKRRTFDEKELQEREKELNLQIEEMLKKAEAADAEGGKESGELPNELRGKARLREQVRAAQTALRAQAQQRTDEREADRAAWKKEPIGECPRQRAPKPRPDERINLTDPQSALMPLPSGPYAQAYNGQLAVTAEGPTLIVAAEVCAQSNDRLQLQPMVEAIAATCGKEFKRIVADRGYDNARQIHAIETRLGVEVVCCPQPTAGRGPSRHRQACHRKATQAIRSRMKERAQSSQGQHWLRRRRMTVEPAFGILKSALGFRQFRLRGLERVNLEWKLAAVAFNCLRLNRARR